MVWLSWYVGGVGYHWWGTLHNCKFLVIKIAHDWQPWIFLPNTHFLLTSGLHCTLRHCQFETYHTHTEDTSSLNYWFDFWMISFDDLVRTGPYAPNYNWILRFKKIPKPWTRTELRSSTYMWFDMIWSTFRSSHIFICLESGVWRLILPLSLNLCSSFIINKALELLRLFSSQSFRFSWIYWKFSQGISLRQERLILNGISYQRMVLLIISLIFTMMARSITTAFMPRSMMFSTMGSKASVHRFVSTTPEVSYRRKAVSRGWTLTQKMATLGKDIWVLQFDGGSRGKLLATSHKCSNWDNFFIYHLVLNCWEGLNSWQLSSVGCKIFVRLGNPGRAGSGSVIYKSTLGGDKRTEKCVLDDSEEMWNGYHYLGESVTNNVAEYSGLIEGLKQAVSMNIPSLLIQGEHFWHLPRRLIPCMLSGS